MFYFSVCIGKRLLCLFAFACLPLLNFANQDIGETPRAEVLEFSYPASENKFYQQRNDYFLRMLTLALSKTDQPFRLTPVPMAVMNEKRSKIFIKSGRYNIHWMLTNKEFESA